MILMLRLDLDNLICVFTPCRSLLIDESLPAQNWERSKSKGDSGEKEKEQEAAAHLFSPLILNVG